MSIGIYAFLSIYFLSFGLSAFAQFRTHFPPSSAAAVPIAQRASRPGVCAGAWRCLPCIWHGLRCCLCCAVRPGALGAGVSTGGAYRERLGVGWVDSLRRKNSKKAFSVPTHPLFPTQITPAPIVHLQNSAAKTKRPLQRVCVLCYTCLTILEREESIK